jgi:hypothetical protein
MQSLDPDDPKNLPPTWSQAVELLQLFQDGRIPRIDDKRFAQLSRDDVAQLLSAGKQIEPPEIRSETEPPEAMPDPVRPENPSPRAPLASPAASEENARVEHNVQRLVPPGDASSEKQDSTVRAGQPQENGARFQVAKPASTPSSIVSWFGVFFCNTVVNLGFLCCLASLIGALYYAARQQIDDAARQQTDGAARQQRTGNPRSDGLPWYLSGIVQGFVVYLAALAGMLAVGELPIESVTTTRYARIAGIVSVLSFWAGYTPGEFFASIFSRAISGHAQAANPTKPQP